MSHPHATIPGSNAGLFAVSLGTVANWILTWFPDFQVTTFLAVVSTLVTFYCAVPSVFKTTAFIKAKIAERKGDKP